MESSPWLVCAACGLRHSPRPDGRCPRCHAPSESERVDAPGAAYRPPPPPPLSPVVAPSSSREGPGLFTVGLVAAGTIGLLLLGFMLFVPKAREFWGAFARRGPVEKNAIVHVSGRTWQLAFVAGSWRRAPSPLFLDVYHDLPSRHRTPFTDLSVEAEVVRGMGEARVYVLRTGITRSGLSPDLEKRVDDTMDDRLEDWALLEPVPLAGRVGPHAVHGTATHRREKVEVLCAVVAEAPTLHLVVALASAARFAQLRGEIVDILQSFRPLDGGAAPAPGG